MKESWRPKSTLMNSVSYWISRAFFIIHPCAFQTFATVLETFNALTMGYPDSVSRTYALAASVTKAMERRNAQTLTSALFGSRVIKTLHAPIRPDLSPAHATPAFGAMGSPVSRSPGTVIRSWKKTLVPSRGITTSTQMAPDQRRWWRWEPHK